MRPLLPRPIKSEHGLEGSGAELADSDLQVGRGSLCYRLTARHRAGLGSGGLQAPRFSRTWPSARTFCGEQVWDSEMEGASLAPGPTIMGRCYLLSF